MSKALIEIPYTTGIIVGAMSNRQKIQESVYYSGALNQVDLLLDVDMLLAEANLTEKQLQVVKLYFFNQYTQEEVSKLLGISQQAVLDHIGKVKKKINRVLERWNKLDEEKFNNR